MTDLGLQARCLSRPPRCSSGRVSTTRSSAVRNFSATIACFHQSTAFSHCWPARCPFRGLHPRRSQDRATLQSSRLVLAHVSTKLRGAPRSSRATHSELHAYPLRSASCPLHTHHHHHHSRSHSHSHSTLTSAECCAFCAHGTGIGVYTAAHPLGPWVEQSQIGCAEKVPLGCGCGFPLPRVYNISCPSKVAATTFAQQNSVIVTGTATIPLREFHSDALPPRPNGLFWFVFSRVPCFVPPHISASMTSDLSFLTP